MPARPNLLFLWTDQQRYDTMAAYGNDRIETPNLNGLADRSTVFERAYVSQPLCGPSRSTVMTGRYPHTTGVTANNVPLRASEKCFPELGEFDDYLTGWIGKWHLGDEVFAQHGFDEWVSTEDGYRAFYSADRPDDAHSDYHDYLLDRGYEPDVESDDGFRSFSRGFAARLPEEHTKPAFMARAARRFIEDAAERDRPFILHVMFLEPHAPYTSPRDDQYHPDDVPLPANFSPEHFDDQIDKVRFARELVRQGVDHASRDPYLLGDPPTEAEWRELISNYWGLVSLVDTHVGSILDALEDCGLDSETITAFTSDHGDMMGSHRLFNKMVLFEEAIRVPLLLRVPGLRTNGTTVEHPISHVDLVPTLLDAMGQPVPDQVQGQSWLPVLRGEGALDRENVFVEYNGATAFGMHDRSSPTHPDWDRPAPEPEAAEVWTEMGFERDVVRAMTTPVRTVITPDGWKLNYRRSGEHELYDLAADPHETENLADERPERVDDLYGAIVDWQRETRDPVYL